MARVALPEGLITRPVAHRGYHDRAAGRIENTPAAFRAAIAAGYGIELDVQLSSDGVAMVFHDDMLERLTSARGPVSARSATELEALVVTGGSDRIWRFRDVLALIAGRVPVLVEIKDQTGNMGPSDGRLEAAVAADLVGYTGEVALMSFNPHSVLHLAQLAPDVARGITTSAYDVDDWAPLPPEICARLREIPDYARSEASFISHEAGDLDRPRVAEIAAEGGAILCWTITSPEAERAARSVADNVTFEGYAAVQGV